MFGVGYVSLLSLELYWNMLLSTMLQGKVWQIAIYMERHTQVMNTYLLKNKLNPFCINFANYSKAIGWNQFNVVKKENSQGFLGLNQTFLGPDHKL